MQVNDAWYDGPLGQDGSRGFLFDEGTYTNGLIIDSQIPPDDYFMWPKEKGFCFQQGIGIPEVLTRG